MDPAVGDAGDLERALVALGLEYGASRRYGYQADGSPFPRINSIFEGISRTEGDHLDALVRLVRRLQPAGTPGTGRGFATLLTHLKTDLAFEREAVKTYGRLAREAQDPELREALKAFARSEAGHAKMLGELVARIEAGEYPVIVYCPICGWEIDFGCAPEAGATLVCERCRQPVRLDLEDDDFVPRA
jgi:rubrerythrin